MGLDEPVHRDHRGEIHRLDIGGVKFNVLITKAGVLRSGDYHPNTQYDIILSGEMEITLRQDDKDVVIRKGPNDLISIPSETPHLFRSLTDTVMIEWWGGKFECKYYKPYRDLIDKQAEQYKK
ncbi:MAG: cupin domain-containing protein [Nanoarchaeota archaeon]